MLGQGQGIPAVVLAAGLEDAVPVAGHWLRVDGIDLEACSERGCDELPLPSAFDGHVNLRRLWSQAPDHCDQFLLAVDIVREPEGGRHLPLGRQVDVMMLAGLVDSDAQHDGISLAGRSQPLTVTSWKRCSRHGA